MCRPKDNQRFLNYHWANTEEHKHSELTKEKLRIAKIGDRNPMKRIEVRNKVSNALKGKPSWNKDKRLSEIHCKNLSISHLGNIPSLDTRQKMSLARSGEKHWNWQGGKSFEPYPLGWNRTYKEQIRYRDRYRCQLCGVPEIECGQKLSVHHIDYNKKNIQVDNLISLCRSCHTKTSCNKEYYLNYFTSRVVSR
jgi:5-methylcytosine-specific restriction endonuclease McrA